MLRIKIIRSLFQRKTEYSEHFIVFSQNLLCGYEIQYNGLLYNLQLGFSFDSFMKNLIVFVSNSYTAGRFVNSKKVINRITEG